MDAAENKLSAMLAGADPEEVTIKRQQVEATQQSLELARQSLELARQSPKLAQQSLVYAQKQLDKATLTAPFSGVVAEVYPNEGEIVSVSTTIVHLIDPASIELKAEVDEIDIPRVKPGQRAIISVDALPDIELEGEVTVIAPSAKEEAGVRVYGVRIRFDIPTGSGLKPGMSATAAIIVDERNNVLLVRSRAVKRDNQGRPIVEVMAGEQVEERPVVTGLSNGRQTEIVSGLSEGETVVVEPPVE